MPFPFFNLPRELQDTILWYTPAVCRFQPVHDEAGVDKDYVPQGIWIRNGKLRYPWGSLLCVSHSFTGVVKDMLFSFDNRFVLSGDPTANKSWLMKQSSRHLKQIRKLDLLLEWDDLHAFHGQNLRRTNGGYEDKKIVLARQYEKAWMDLISVIPQLFDVSQTHLAVDAAFINLKLRSNFDLENDGIEPEGVQDWEDDTIRYRCMYWTVFYPFALNKSELSRLASYHIYLPVHREEETKFERLLMGPEYDSVRDHGKIKYKWRDPRLPHGFDEWEWFGFWHAQTDDERDRIYNGSTTMYDANEFGWMETVVLAKE